MNLLLIFRCLINKDTNYFAKCKVCVSFYTGMNGFYDLFLYYPVLQ